MRDHRGVDLLLKLASTRCIGPFMRAEHTLGSAAAELDMAASTLAYYVGRFVKAGLVEVVRLQPRAGKPIPVYRATADEFHIPFSAMPSGRRDEFLHSSRKHVLAEFVAAIDRQLVDDHDDNGIRVVADPVRGVQIDFIDNGTDDDLVATEWWGSIRLTDDDARAMRTELEAIVARYTGREAEGRGSRGYIAMVGLVPDGRRRRRR